MSLLVTIFIILDPASPCDYFIKIDTHYSKDLLTDFYAH